MTGIVKSALVDHQTKEQMHRLDTWPILQEGQLPNITEIFRRNSVKGLESEGPPRRRRRLSLLMTNCRRLCRD